MGIRRQCFFFREQPLSMARQSTLYDRIAIGRAQKQCSIRKPFVSSLSLFSWRHAFVETPTWICQNHNENHRYRFFRCNFHFFTDSTSRQPPTFHRPTSPIIRRRFDDTTPTKQKNKIETHQKCVRLNLPFLVAGVIIYSYSY